MIDVSLYKLFNTPCSEYWSFSSVDTMHCLWDYLWAFHIVLLLLLLLLIESFPHFSLSSVIAVMEKLSLLTL